MAFVMSVAELLQSKKMQFLTNFAYLFAAMVFQEPEMIRRFSILIERG
jgi:hypothetical protein